MNTFTPSQNKHDFYLRLGFALFASFGAIWVGEIIYLGEYITTDENSYLFQTWLFLNGEMRAETPPLAAKDLFFHRMIILDENAGWLSRYPPAQPLWLVPGMWIGYPRAMTAVAAFISLWFTIKAGERLNIPIWITATLMLISPYFWLMQGSVLSHTSGLAVTAIMTWAFLIWTQNNKIRYAAIAGLAWAFLFLNRTYTSSWIAIAFGVFALIHLLRNWQTQRLIGTLAFAACASIGAILFLFYNNLVSGDPYLSSYLYYDPADGPGFGQRHSVKYTVTHTLEKGWDTILFNLQTLNLRLWGFSGSLIAWLALALIGWKKRITLLLLSSTFLVWISYIAFWFRGIPEVAPIYYYETLVFVVLSAGLGVHRLCTLNWPMPLLAKKMSLSLVFLLVSVSALSTFKQTAQIITDQNRLKQGYQKVIHDVPPHSIVLLSNVPKDILDQATWNPYGLQSEPLIMRDGWGVTRIIHQLFPNRAIYKVSGHQPMPAQIIQKNESPTFLFSAIQMRATTGEKNNHQQRVAKQGSHRAGLISYGHKQYLMPGDYSIIFKLQAKPVDASAPLTDAGYVELYSHSSNESIIHQPIPAESKSIHIKMHLPTLTIIEPKVFYSGKGHLMMEQIKITQLN